MHHNNSTHRQYAPHQTKQHTKTNQEEHQQPNHTNSKRQRVRTSHAATHCVTSFTSQRAPAIYLPLQSSKHQGRKTLVLDLDETLVHSTFQETPDAGIVLQVKVDGQEITVYVLVRPGLKEFLQKACSLYEVVLFTASLSNYADPLASIIDPKKEIPFRLFREHCIFSSAGFVKDLLCLGRNLSNVFIIDNSPTSYMLQRENALPITSWYGDTNDIELYTYIPILEELNKAPSITNALSKIILSNQILPNAAYLLKRENIRLEEEARYKTRTYKVNNYVSIEKAEQKAPTHTDNKTIKKVSVSIKDNTNNDIIKLIKRITACTPNATIKPADNINKIVSKSKEKATPYREDTKKLYGFATPTTKEVAHHTHSSMKFRVEEPKPCGIYSNLLRMSVNVKKETAEVPQAKQGKPQLLVNTFFAKENVKSVCASTTKAKDMGSDASIKMTLNSPKYSTKYQQERAQSSACNLSRLGKKY